MHIVHYSTKYTSLGDAVKQPGGLAVIGVMYEVHYTLHSKQKVLGASVSPIWGQQFHWAFHL